MRSVLVPLDGSPLAEAILPDALRLAGESGRLVLVRDALTTHSVFSPAEPDEDRAASEQSEIYLESVAGRLQADHVVVEVHSLDTGEAAVAIDWASRVFGADMIAAATHGRTPAERWLRGGIAWRALVRSTVPVLLRHVDLGAHLSDERSERRILVPLDGSSLAEKALSLAEELAVEWHGTIFLTRVVPNPLENEALLVEGLATVNEARDYLLDVEKRLGGNVRASVLEGQVVESLAAGAGAWGITDIVMTSHGRTGVSRAIVGSVADELIQRLRCPIIVIPPLVTLDWGHRPA